MPNVDVIIKNLELLRGLTPYSKEEFSKIIGVANAFRRDYKTLGRIMETGIKNNFQGVDRKWLLSEHPNGLNGIIFTPCKSTAPAEPKAQDWRDEELYKSLRREVDFLRELVVKTRDEVRDLNARCNTAGENGDIKLLKASGDNG
jgi:hypothetical protein